MDANVIALVQGAILELSNLIAADKNVQHNRGRINNILVDPWVSGYIVSMKVFYSTLGTGPLFYHIHAFINSETYRVEYDGL